MDEYGYDERRRWIRLAGILMLTLMVAAAAFAVGRLSAPSSEPAQRATTTAQSGPGPTRVVNGVPVGYAHTQDGAVAAATNFLMVMGGPLVTQPDKYLSAIDTLAAPEARSKLHGDANRIVAGLQNGSGLVTYAQQGRAVIYRQSPLAYHIDAFNDGTAKVSIWSEGFVAVDGLLPLRETWSTSQISVAWSGDDWKAASFQGPTDTPGPVPTTIQPSSQGVSLPPQLSTYRSYRIDVGA